MRPTPHFNQASTAPSISVNHFGAKSVRPSTHIPLVQHAQLTEKSKPLAPNKYDPTLQPQPLCTPPSIPLVPLYDPPFTTLVPHIQTDIMSQIAKPHVCPTPTPGPTFVCDSMQRKEYAERLAKKSKDLRRFNSQILKNLIIILTFLVPNC